MDATERRADAGRLGRIAGLGRRADVVINQANTVNIDARTPSEPGYVLSDFPLSAPPIPAASGHQPSKLLAARYRVVPFAERESELRLLAAWRDDPGLGVAVRLVHGPGGEGKSRLAAEFATSCATAGWQVSEPVRKAAEASAVSADEAAQTGRRHVVIVDYAERWPPSDLIDMIRDPLLRDAQSVRVLLLARPAGAWWESLEYGLGESDIVADRMPLAPLAYDLDARFRVFTAARDRFADVLGADKDDERLSLRAAVFANDAYSRALTIHMAALATVQSVLRAELAPVEPVAVSEYLLRREREQWRRLFLNSESFRTRPEVMARAVYTAILTRPLPYDVALTVLDRVGLASSAETASQILDDHAVCYPAGAGFLEPLYPDRLAEDFVALQTPGYAASQQDPWAANAVGRLLALDAAEAVPDWAGQAVTILIEISRRWPHFAERQLCPLLIDKPWLAVAAGGQQLLRLAGIPDIAPEVFFAVESSLPGGARVDLDAGIAEITARVAAERLASTSNEEARGDILRNLGWRQANAGLFAEASRASDQAAQIFAKLAPSEPTQSKLAQALHDLGRSLAELGEIGEALTATDRAVTVYQRLVAAGAVNLESRLAAALTDLGRGRWQQGETDKALAVTGESISIYKRLVSELDGASGPADGKAVKRRAQLARALRIQGAMLSDVDAAAALAATTEAVDILDNLAATDPPAYETDLAAALDNLGSELARQGSHAAALAATQRAVDIGRKLEPVNPAVVQPKLAMWTVHLGSQLMARGRVQDGLRALSEAVAALRRLARASPAGYGAGLAVALSELAAGLAVNGRDLEAVPQAAEAVARIRVLGRTRPWQHDADLAAALGLLAQVRAAAETGLPAALGNAEEAMSIYQALAVWQPASYDRALRAATSLAADLLTRLGRSDEAEQLRSGRPGSLPGSPWLESLEAEPVEPVDDVVREAAGRSERIEDVRAAVAAADLYALRDRASDQPVSSDDVAADLHHVVLGPEDGDAMTLVPVFTNEAAIRTALARIPDSHRLAIRIVSGRAILSAIGDDVVPVVNLWSDSQFVLLSRSAAAGADFGGSESAGLEELEAVLREAGRRTGEAGVVRAAIRTVEVYALGHTAGDTSVPGRGTEADLLHFGVDLAGEEVVMLPVFTNSAVMREALLRNADWQQMWVLSVNGGALLDNIDDEVVLVINPWSDLEFQIPSRLTARTAAAPEQGGSSAL